MTAVLSIAGLMVTLFLGLIGWRVQLVGKRRVEVAEEAILGFERAANALSMIRSPVSLGGEIEALRKEIGAPEDGRIQGESYRITLWRLQHERDSFTDLRRLQVLCRYHFGPDAEDAIAAIWRARHRVWVGAHMGASMDRRDFSSREDRALYQSWEAAIWEGSTDPDEIAASIIGARKKLDAILAPYFRADAALIPLVDKWRSISRRLPRLNARTVEPS